MIASRSLRWTPRGPCSERNSKMASMLDYAHRRRAAIE
jgi:hypothetical protein